MEWRSAAGLFWFRSYAANRPRNSQPLIETHEIKRQMNFGSGVEVFVTLKYEKHYSHWNNI